MQMLMLSCPRGICHKGKDCDYLHQLPTEYHEQLLTSDHTVDIFGRDKLPGSHTGTKGVGTYDRESKTLYVNYGGAGHLGAPVIRQLVQVMFWSGLVWSGLTLWSGPATRPDQKLGFL